MPYILLAASLIAHASIGRIACCVLILCTVPILSTQRQAAPVSRGATCLCPVPDVSRLAVPYHTPTWDGNVHMPVSDAHRISDGALSNKCSPLFDGTNTVLEGASVSLVSCCEHNINAVLLDVAALLTRFTRRSSTCFGVRYTLGHPLLRELEYYTLTQGSFRYLKQGRGERKWWVRLDLVLVPIGQPS
jgi:hypothetical protein